jgi:hypothetical protein
MRPFFALLALAGLTACGETQAQPEPTVVVRLNDELRQQQVALDVIVMLKGMQQALDRRLALARHQPHASGYFSCSTHALNADRCAAMNSRVA